MKLEFLGAVDGVTGSSYLLSNNKIKILIDCGLFQGTYEEEEKNWEPFPVNPKEVDYMILTHSHIDHIGLLPKFFKDGFRGIIYTTPPTADFCQIFLPDSQHLLEKSAIYKKKEILYTQIEIDGAMKLFKPVDYHQKQKISDNITFEFFDAGHILGSAFIKINFGNKSIVFSGDLGNPPVPIIRDTEFISDADYIVIESTYGDRTHAGGEHRIDELENIIEETYSQGGTVLIPAFALERTQELLFELHELVQNNRIPKIPIYIDSPLAIKATQVYPKYKNYFDQESVKLITQNENLFDFPGLEFVDSVEKSKLIDRDDSPKIVIAGSGMSTGGRILYHEKKYLSNPNATLVIVGYQVRGTLGRRLSDGEKIVTIHGETIKVNCKIVSLDSYSAHADAPKLVYWLSKMDHNIKKIFLTHGEQNAKNELKTKIQDELGVETYLPKYKEEFKL